ncbi:YceG family protein [Bacillus sp. Marseille-P3661]|uniref:YceG family protein n=1 Tax=Bacillus sp. Marseille-P3661 TaxID=1936234 RepID=UPI000C81F8F2|nr:YceG family protein [Bacillus sp. Marseille-P3661]
MHEYHSIKISQSIIDGDKWKDSLFLPLPDRKPYEINKSELHFSQLSARILGTTYDETDYFIDLHELSNREEVHILSECLDKSIQPERFQAIQRIHMINQKENGLSVNRFVAFLDGERLIPSHSNYAMRRHLRQSLMTVLESFKNKHTEGFNDPDFRRVLVDLIKWTWNHLHVWLEGFDVKVKMPHVIWYGDATKSQLYFLYYLMLIGCDVLIFHPEGKDQFQEIDPGNDISQIVTYPATAKLQPFPIEKPERQSTVAYRATKEMDNVLHHEGSQLYKPWQFRNHIPSSVTLKTTYDELFLIAKERAFIRPGFNATKEVVEIPTIFAKVMGVSKNKKEYWDRLQTLSDYKNTVLIRKFPFTEEINVNQQFHYQHSLNSNGRLDPEKMQRSNWWQYKHLPSGTQNALAHTISNMCANPRLLQKNSETVDQIKLYLFAHAINIPAQFLNLMQVFDFSQEVPKLVLYNTELNGTLSRSDAALLLLLNEYGIDIVLYNPPGHNCVENYIDSNAFDTHWLEEMSFEQEFKEPNFIQKLLKSIKF